MVNVTSDRMRIVSMFTKLGDPVKLLVPVIVSVSFPTSPSI